MKNNSERFVKKRERGIREMEWVRYFLDVCGEEKATCTYFVVKISAL